MVSFVTELAHWIVSIYSQSIGSSRRTFNLILVLSIAISATFIRYPLAATLDDTSRLQYPGTGHTNLPRESVLMTSESQGLHQTARDKAAQLEIRFASHLLAQNGDRMHTATPRSDEFTTTIVLGRMSAEKDTVQWIDKLHSIDSVQMYIVDDANSTGPHLAKNHGREAAVYLSYIVQHYEDLNDITFFWHNNEQVWHNNILLEWDSVQTINKMDRHNIIKTGYVPSRCDHWPGCPQWIR